MEATLASTKLFRRECLRKSLHLPTFFFPAMALYARNLSVMLLGFLVVGYSVLFLMEQAGKRGRVFDWVNLLRRTDSPDPAPIYLGIAMMACLIFFEPGLVFYAAYVIAICDSGAALVGMKLGKHKLSGSKTVEGSAAFFVLAFVGGLFFASPVLALIAAFILTLVELFSKNGFDNLFLPLASQLILLLHV